MPMRSTFLALTLAAAAALTASAASAANHPALTGMWILAPGEYFGSGVQMHHDDMPLTDLGRRISTRSYSAVEKDQQVLSDANKKCLPIGMPGFMGNEFALEVLDTGDRVTMLSENSPVPRTIYLDRTTHTRGTEPSWNGHSIGRWDGDALVVDTVNMNDRISPISFSGGVHSSTTHLVERIHLSADGKQLIDDMTFEDPRYLTKPFTKRHVFNRLPKDAELWEYVCEVDAAGWSERYAGEKAQVSSH